VVPASGNNEGRCAIANIRNIALVHGGFVDGSGWQPVYKILTGEGFNVRVVQNPTLSLADDVAVTKRAIASSDGPVILVGHSYGGAVVSEAGTNPKVKAWFISRLSHPTGVSPSRR
jgi:pimeloyl-ACP methyl ester carboxylesterase